MVTSVLRMRKLVYQRIMNSLGERIPECGGVLGAGSDGVISEYYFDETGKSELDAYIPDVEMINRVLEMWHENGVHMVGIVHSHREGLTVPSCGDIVYGARILEAIDVVDEFYLPVLEKCRNDSVLHGYAITRLSQRIRCEVRDVLLVE